MNIPGSLAVPLLILALVGGTTAEDDLPLPFTEELDSDQLVTLKWGFDDVEGNITFELSVKTTGWIGFGLSPNGGMNGADIVIGGMHRDGRQYFGDYHADGYKTPVLDQKQSYTLLSLTEADGQTTMRFERPIKTCDTNDRPITELPVKVIYAFGEEDEIKYHRQLRGTKELNLLKYAPSATHLSSHYFDMNIIKYPVPAKDTHYGCRVMEGPRFDDKQHIHMVEPVIDHVDLVHHMLLYKCPLDIKDTFQEGCFINPDHDICNQIVAAWGIGGGDFHLPKHVGIPIGGEEVDFLYRLEIHYNNPTLIEGRLDSSGFRLYYTSNLRQYDAGILATGLAVTPGYVIPPGASSFHTYGVCDTSLIPEAMPDLKVIASVLHTHLVGRKIRVGHFRDGRQLGFMTLDEHYDFEFQQFKYLGKTKTLKKGDSLQMECTYDTSKRTELTEGGYSTQQEMCLAFFLYYPATNLSNCVSFPHMEALVPKLGASNLGEVYAKLKQKKWDEQAVKEYERMLKDIPQYITVDNGDDVYWSSTAMKDMMATPTPSCEEEPNTSNMAHVSWISLLVPLVWVCALQ